MDDEEVVFLVGILITIFNCKVISGVNNMLHIVETPVAWDKNHTIEGKVEVENIPLVVYLQDDFYIAFLHVRAFHVFEKLCC